MFENSLNGWKSQETRRNNRGAVLNLQPFHRKGRRHTFVIRSSPRARAMNRQAFKTHRTRDTKKSKRMNSNVDSLSDFVEDSAAGPHMQKQEKHEAKFEEEYRRSPSIHPSVHACRGRLAIHYTCQQIDVVYRQLRSDQHAKNMQLPRNKQLFSRPSLRNTKNTQYAKQAHQRTRARTWYNTPPLPLHTSNERGIDTVR